MQVKLKHLAVLLVLLITVQSNLVAQAGTKDDTRFINIEKELQQRAKSLAGLNNPVNISVNHSPLQEIIRAIAIENNLNVSVDVRINEQPSYNFANATVAEVFLFLCKEHDLYLNYTGNIIAFKRFVAPEKELPPAVAKSINLSLNKATSLINADLKQDTLYNVIRKLSQLSGKNIQLDDQLHQQLTTMVIVNQDLKSVIDRLAGENEVEKVTDGFYKITKIESGSTSSNESNGQSRGRNSTRNNRGNSRSGSSSNRSGGSADIVVEKQDSTMTLSAYDSPLKDIVEQLSEAAGVDFFLFKEPKGNLTLNITGAKYEEILAYVLNTSDFTYKYVDGIYVIGERKEESLRFTTIHQLQFRTVEDVVNVIPSEIKKNVEVKEFAELNSIVLSGAQPQIMEIINFLTLIDKVVPVVLIEVMIVDINKSHTISTGLKIGRDATQTSTGSFGVTGEGRTRAVLNSDLLNTIVNSISNLGIFNLGVVGSGFYVEMSALEENGSLKLHSTPKLATLNGHEAKLTVGETKYYAVDQTNVIGAQSPQVVQTKTYNSVNADLAVTIKPMVSGNDQITLEITVSQSTFGVQEGDAPPEFQTREFQSLIRMKNQEMVILGGLEQNKNSKSASGVPFLARIPIIKWFFSSTNKEKEESKLTIFIRPTIIY